MAGLWEALVVGQYALTALLAGFNTLYFATHSWPEQRKRVGALVLAVVSAGALVQSLAFGLILFRRPPGGEPWTWLAAGGLGLLGTALITLLILRNLLGSGR